MWRQLKFAIANFNFFFFYWNLIWILIIYLGVLFISNRDRVLVIAADAGRARSLKSVGARAQWLREIEPRVHGIAHLRENLI